MSRAFRLEGPEYGAAGRIRTHDPLVRSQVLYPTELQPRRTRTITQLFLNVTSLSLLLHQERDSLLLLAHAVGLLASGSWLLAHGIGLLTCAAKLLIGTTALARRARLLSCSSRLLSWRTGLLTHVARL